MRRDGTKDMVDVDAWLTDARDRPAPEWPDDLMARILADADAARVGQVVAASTKTRWRDWIEALGGWPAMGGLVAAGVAGLWIGVAPSDTVNDVMAQILGETVSLALVPEAGVFDWGAEG